MTLQRSPDVFIAGCGPGSRSYVTPRVAELAMNAQLLAGVPSLLNLFPLSKAMRLVQNGAIEPWLDRLEATPARPCVVLVAGDPGRDELTQQVLTRFGRERCRIEPGISLTQAACAALGLAWHEVVTVDLRTEVVPQAAHVAARLSTALYLMGAHGAEAMVAEIIGQDAGQCIVIEDLALSTQTVSCIAPNELAQLPERAGRIVVSKRASASMVV